MKIVIQCVHTVHPSKKGEERCDRIPGSKQQKMMRRRDTNPPLLSHATQTGPHLHLLLLHDSLPFVLFPPAFETKTENKKKKKEKI